MYSLQTTRSSDSHLTIAIAITPPTHCKPTPCNPYITCSKESSNSARELAQWNPPASPPSPTRCSTFQISSAQKKKQQFSKRKGQTPIHTYGRIHYFHPIGTQVFHSLTASYFQLSENTDSCQPMGHASPSTTANHSGTTHHSNKYLGFLHASSGLAGQTGG